MARMSLGSLLLLLPLLTCSNPVNNTSSSTSPTISSTPSTSLATTASDATEKFSNMSASSSTAKPTITMMSNIETSTSTSIPTSSSNGTSTTSFSSESNDNSSSPTSLPPTSTTSSAAPPISSSMASNSTIKQRDVGSNMPSIHQLAGSISADSDGAQRRDISSGEQVSGNSDGSSAGEGEQPDGGQAGELPLMPARLSIGVQQRQPQGNDSQEEASNSTGLLSSTTAASASTTRNNSNHGTTNSTTNRPEIRSKRDYISDAVERMKEAASNTQQQLQQAGNLASLPNNSNQLQTQVIPIPPIDLSGQQTQNIVLVSDNGNVTLRRGQNFLSVETVMLQQKN